MSHGCLVYCLYGFMWCCVFTSDQLCCDSVSCCITLLSRFLCNACQFLFLLSLLLLVPSFVNLGMALGSIASCFFTYVIVGDASVDFVSEC